MPRNHPSIAFSAFPQSGAFVPAADVMAGDGDLLLTVDLPGLTADDVSIEVQDSGFLMLRGVRPRPRDPDGMSCVQAERPFGAFERRIQIPKGVDPDAITVSMQHGVLSLIVSEPEQIRPPLRAISSPDEQYQAAAA